MTKWRADSIGFIRVLLIVFILGFVLSGVAAFPLAAELGLLANMIDGIPGRTLRQVMGPPRAHTSHIFTACRSEARAAWCRGTNSWAT